MARVNDEIAHIDIREMSRNRRREESQNDERKQ